MSIEPHLQPITGETFTHASANIHDGARLDVAARGFWGSHFEREFFDVKVFHPHAPSNMRSQLSSCYRLHENTKKRAYERIREVEHGSFTPLIMSSTGLGHAATCMYKRLAHLFYPKCDQPYCKTMGWLRCSLTFSLLKSSIMCIKLDLHVVRPNECFFNFLSTYIPFHFSCTIIINYINLPPPSVFFIYYYIHLNCFSHRKIFFK